MEFFLLTRYDLLYIYGVNDSRYVCKNYDLNRYDTLVEAQFITGVQISPFAARLLVSNVPTLST